MTDFEEQGLWAVWALNGDAQAIRRESRQWRSMSRDERRDEILTFVAEAAKGSFARREEVRTRAIAEQVFRRAATAESATEKRDLWTYWVDKSEEKSQDGWVAWRVVQMMVLRLSEEDPEQLKEPPLSEWLARVAADPRPARGRGSPRGAKGALHRVAVLGVYALLEAGLCDLTGRKKGEGLSCCDLVARELDVGWRTVYLAWRAHEKQVAACVDYTIALLVRGRPDWEFCYIARLALMDAAGSYHVDCNWVFKVWRKEGEFAKVLR